MYTKRKNDKTEVDFRLSFFVFVCTYLKNDETKVVFCFSFFCFSLQVKKLISGDFDVFLMPINWVTWLYFQI